MPAITPTRQSFQCQVLRFDAAGYRHRAWRERGHSGRNGALLAQRADDIIFCPAVARFAFAARNVRFRRAFFSRVGVEAALYASWQTPDIKSSVHSHATTVDELRAEGIYEILSPEECRRRAKERGDAGLAVLHPLCAGIPIDRGWECLQLYADSLHDVA